MSNEEKRTVEMEVSHLKKYYKAGWHSVRIGMWKDDLWKDLHWNAG